MVKTGLFWYNNSMKKEEYLAKFDTLNEEEKRQFISDLLDARLQDQQALEHLQSNYEQLKAFLFGRRSEKKSSIPECDKVSLFNEFEIEEELGKIEEQIENIKGYTRKAKGKKNLLNDDNNFPVEVIEHRLDDLTCPECGSTLTEIGYDTRKELCVIPAKFYVKEHRYYKYTCKNCSSMEQVEREVIPFPNSMYSSSLVTKFIHDKYVASIPFYRQEQIYRDLGINITRANMIQYLNRAYDLMEPLYQLYAGLLKKVDILHCDETRLKVLSEKNELNNVKSNYVWLYRTSKYNEKKILFYYYNDGRKYSNVVDFFKNETSTKKWIHADGYGAYEHVQGYTLVSCLVHARRQFTDTITKIRSNNKVSNVSAKIQICNKYINLIGELYKYESLYDKENISFEERKERRLKDQKPILDVFFSELKKDQTIILPKSDLGKAIDYCLKREKSLVTYLEDGRLELDNNLSEHMAKKFAVGRKNWLFCENPKGAIKTCVMYTIVETAIANGLKPSDYINWYLDNVSTTTSDKIEDLAPWSDKIPDNIKR